MKKCSIVLLITIFLSFRPVYGHGFGVHMAHLPKIIALNDQYRALIEDPRFQPYFLYGSIFPDIQYATNFKPAIQNMYSKIREIKLLQISEIDLNVPAFEGLTYEFLMDQIPDKNIAKYPFGIDTHDDKYGMAFAEYLLQQCAPIDPPGPNPGSNGTSTNHDARNMKLAFALGYYAHLAEDVAAHDFMIPKLTATLNLGDIELAKSSQSFAEDPNGQTEGIIEGIVDHYYGDNALVADVVFNKVWVARSQYEPSVLPQQLVYNGPTPTIYDAPSWPDLNPVFLFFNEVLNNWYNNNPFSLPASYKQPNAPMSATGLRQLATIFRFVNRFYPAVVGHPFNGKNRLDEVLSDWVANHLDLSDAAVASGLTVGVAAAGFLGLVAAVEFRVEFLPGLAYPSILKDFSNDLAGDARTLVALMLSDISEADNIVNANASKINLTEYNKLKNSILFTNPTSVLAAYWNEYSNLGTTVYHEVGPSGKWYTDWSPWHAHSMAWGAINSMNNSLSDIYLTNPNVAVYDAYFEVAGRRITGPEPTSTFQNNSTATANIEVYNTSDVTSENLSLQIKKDHSSPNYTSDDLVSTTTFSLDQNPSTYNSTARYKLIQNFSISLTDLSNSSSRGYYFEVIKNSASKAIFTTNFEQYQEQLALTPNYIKLYGTYDEGKWPVSLGLAQALATTTLNVPAFIDGPGSGGSYKINGTEQTSIVSSIGSYIVLEAVPPPQYSFISWSDGNTENPRSYRVEVATNLYANYKGSLASNNASAMSSSSQRKIVRTPVKPGLPNGTLHLVYISAGYIWYETSTDNGVTWQLMNNNQPVSGYGGKLPSISWNEIEGNGAQAVLITYQQGEQLVIKCFRTTSSGTTFNYLGSISPALTAGSSTDKNPVISLNKNFSGGLMILLVWEEKIWAQLQIPPSLHYWLGQLTTSWPEFQSLTSLSEGMISGTSASSTRATLAGSNWYDFHLAWQEGSSSIKYKKILNTNPPNQQTIKNVSSGDGNVSVNSPSIFAVASTNTARLSYVGTNGSMYKTTFRDPDNPYSYWKFGSYVMATNTAINYNDNGYIVAWTQMSDYTYYTRHSTLGGVIRPFLISGGTMFGRDIQVIPGTSFSDMYGAVLSIQTNPYRIKRSDNIQTLGKSETVAETFKGREGVVVKDDAQFYFAFGDVSVDGTLIDFEEKPDSVQMEGLKTLNKFLTTKPFVLSNKSEFSYDAEYGFVDSARCLAALKGAGEVNFKVQLIDAKKGNVIGEYDNVRFNRSDVFQHNNIGYIVNTQGIGNKTVQLRLVVATTLDAKYSLGQWFSTTPVTGLEKSTAERTSINFTGITPVTEYALSQNYPNPFNPSTTIEYQIPKDGMVTIKIYDALGREVITLVNEQKTTGRYSATFDASKLASGMYIYQLVSQPVEGGAKNTFKSVKKMLLLK